MATRPAWSDGQSPEAVRVDESAPTIVMLVATNTPRVRTMSTLSARKDVGLFMTSTMTPSWRTWQQVFPGSPEFSDGHESVNQAETKRL